MTRPQYILLPVSSFFIISSLFCAFMLNLLPWGQTIGVPDFVAITLVFWNIHQPRKVGIGIAFFMGLMMDVSNAVYLGENALAYTLLSYFAISIHRRVMWFNIVGQCWHVFPLFLSVQIVQVLVRLLASSNSSFPSWWVFIECVINTLLWPVATWLLLAPQRRPKDKDENRPI